MAFQTDMMGGGIPAETAKAIVGSISKSVTAAGTTQDTATKVSSAFCIVTTTPANSGIMLPNMYDTDLCIVLNRGANQLKVYPTLDHNIDGAANNTPVTIEANDIGYFWGVGSGNYASDLGGISSNPTFSGLTVTGNASIGGTLGVTGISTFSDALRAGDGSAAAPSYAFTSDIDTGIYYGGAPGRIAFGNGAGTGIFASTSGGPQLASTSQLSWSSGALFAASDVILTRDAANTFAQRNGTNAQTFRIYNTFTDASNYRRTVVDHSSANTVFAAESAGTGGNCDLYLFNRTSGFIEFGTNNISRWTIQAGGHFVSPADNTYDIGASGANRPRTGYFGTSLVTPLIDNGAAGTLQLGNNGGDIRWNKALVALGGGAAPTFGTIGGTGPATAAQNSWMRVLDSTGAAFWVPAWK